MVKYIEFNINEHILVKLTAAGYEHLRVLGYSAPAENAEGYCDFQLWSFMSKFGSVNLATFNKEPLYATDITLVRED